MTSRLAAALVLASFVATGCATAVGRPSASALDEPVAVVEDRTTTIRHGCHRSAASAVHAEVILATLKFGGLTSAYLLLRGEADGAFWGSLTGEERDAEPGAWIGRIVGVGLAGVGAALGAVVAVGVGVSESVEAYGRYREKFDSCVARRLDEDWLAISMPSDRAW